MMRKQNLIFLIVFGIFFGSVQHLVAQRSRVIINHIPKEKVTSSLNSLARKITKNYHTETQKSRAIFMWIATNIGYDSDLRYDPKLQKEYFKSKDRLMTKALQRKKTVCAGYAYLFQALCAEVGIEAAVIDGYTKKTVPSSIVRNKVHHTWNAVKLNGTWELLDITWATSYGSIKNPDAFWYRTRPQDFIYTHYPQNVAWTLLKNPISFELFEGILATN